MGEHDAGFGGPVAGFGKPSEEPAAGFGGAAGFGKTAGEPAAAAAADIAVGSGAGTVAGSGGSWIAAVDTDAVLGLQSEYTAAVAAAALSILHWGLSGA